MSKPVTPFSIGRHPYLLNRWAHLVDVRECRLRGWFMLTSSGNVAFGSWKTRGGALRAARRLERQDGTFRLRGERRR